MQPRFDEHQFAGRRSLPVEAHYAGHGEWASNSLSFDDYSRMNTHSCKPAERRIKTPVWSVNDEALGKMLVVFLEDRAKIRPVEGATLAERLARAKEALQEQRPRLVATLDKLSAEYVSLKQRGNLLPDDIRRKRQLEIQIENIDTQLVQYEKGFEKIVLGVVYHYYRCGMTSAETGMRLGIKPPQARAIIWRLHRTWKRIAPQ